MKHFYLFILTLFIIACNTNNSNLPAKIINPNEGTINISVDESFKPVFDEQIKVYNASFPLAKVVVNYKSEVDCFKDLLKDSTTLIIVSRGLTKDELAYYKNKLSFKQTGLGREHCFSGKHQ